MSRDVVTATSEDMRYEYRRMTPEDYVTVPNSLFSDPCNLSSELCPFDDVVPDVLGGTLFVTQIGFIGISDGSVRAGDKVFILFGGNLPFLLRPSSFEQVGPNEVVPTYMFV
jgi:hypothetical protein